MNDNNRQRDLHKQTFAISIIIFLATVCFSGCTDTKNTDNSLNNKFMGKWTGAVQVSTFSPMGSNNTITELTFMKDTVAVVLTNDRGTYTMNYTYVVNGNNLILEPTFSAGGMMSDRQLFNGTRPSFNGTWPPNGTRPFNDTRPPFNNTWQPNGEQLPDGQRTSMSLSFLYSFAEEYTVLNLEGSKFIKLQ